MTPTALEIIQKHLHDPNGKPTAITDAMIEFANIHAKAALENANRNVRLDVNGEKSISCGFKDSSGVFRSISIDKHSITNSYPPNNIK